MALSIEARLDELDTEIVLQRERIATAPYEALDEAIYRLQSLKYQRQALRRSWSLMCEREVSPYPLAGSPVPGQPAHFDLASFARLSRIIDEVFDEMRKGIGETLDRLRLFSTSFDEPPKRSRQTSFAPFLKPARSVGIGPSAGYGKSGYDMRRRV